MIKITQFHPDMNTEYRTWQREQGIKVDKYTIFRGQGGGKKFIGEELTLDAAHRRIDTDSKFRDGNYYICEYRGGDELEIQKVRKETK